MEQKFGKNSIDIKALREFCEREGKMVEYRKGEQLEREGDPARWFGFVAEGCFKYVTHGISDDKEHITWFSFEGEFVTDYPNCLDGRPSQTFRQNMQTMELRSVIGELILRQHRACYLDLHRAPVLFVPQSPLRRPAQLPVVRLSGHPEGHTFSLRFHGQNAPLSRPEGRRYDYRPAARGKTVKIYGKSRAHVVYCWD